MKHTLKKVDVVRSKPRTTETVGDDGTLDSDYLSKPRRYKWHGERKPFLSLSFMSEDQWASIFSNPSEARPSHDEAQHGKACI